MARKALWLVVAGCAAAGGVVLALSWRVSAQQSPEYELSPEEQREQQRWEQAAVRNERDLGYHGIISGRVTLSDGRPAVGFRVGASFVMHATGAQGEGAAFTGPDGRYRIHGLIASDFRVSVESGLRPYLTPPPVLVDLGSGPGLPPNRRAPGLWPRTGGAPGPVASDPRKVDLVLQPGPWIAVRVHDAETGQPVPGIAVEAWRYGHGYGPSIVTDARGEARFQVGTLNTDMKLIPPPAIAPAIGPAPGYQFQNRMQLAEDALNTWDVRVYRDPDQRKPMALRGTVLGPGDVPLAGARVRMVRWGDETRTTTDEAGRFAIQTVRLGPGEGFNPFVVLRADKDDLSVTRLAYARDTWSPMVLRAERGATASITGVAVDPQGGPRAGVPVRYSEHWPGTSWTSRGSDSGVTDASGRFTISGLSAEAEYLVVLGGAPQYGAGGRTFGYVWYPARLPYPREMRVSRGGTHDIGRIVVPDADASISGRLVGPDGGPPHGDLAVNVDGDTTAVIATLEPDGRFLAEHLVREPLTLSVHYVHDRAYGGGPHGPDVAVRLAVHAGDRSLRIVVPEERTQGRRRHRN